MVVTRPQRPGVDDSGPQLGIAGPVLEALGRFGLGLDGVLHLFIGGLALQIAWNGPDEPADQSGALTKIVDQPAGSSVLWFFVVGFGCLGLMQAAIVAKRHGAVEDHGPVGRSQAVAIGFWYVALAVLAGSYAVGSEAGDSGNDVTARVFGWPAGPFIVGTIGLAVAGVGLYHGWKGLRQNHRGDMHRLDRAGAGGEALVRLGQFGYLAKGAALTLTGVLVILAAAQHDPTDATGLDHGLRTLAWQPIGAVLLTVIGFGLVAFGGYLIAMMRRGKL